MAVNTQPETLVIEALANFLNTEQYPLDFNCVGKKKKTQNNQPSLAI